LHVILGFIASNKRTELQARGRAGRQGNPGSSEVIACFDTDRFIASLPSKVSSALKTLIESEAVDNAELAQVIDFTTRAVYFNRSANRILDFQKQRVVKQALNSYLERVANAAASNQTEKDFRELNNFTPGTPYVMELQRIFSSQFDDMRADIETELQLPLSQDSNDTDDELDDISKLYDAFEKAFGLPFNSPELDLSTESTEAVSDIFNSVAADLNVTRALSQICNAHNIERIVEMLESRAEELIEDFEQSDTENQDNIIGKFLGDNRQDLR
jgi:5'-3' exonuclease